MSRWILGASITGNGYYGPGYVQGGAYIHAQGGGGHGFYGRAHAPHYGWGRGWGDRPHGWGGSRVGIGLNVVINDIGAFFSRLFSSNIPTMSQEPVYYDSAPPVADGYRHERTLSGPAWQPYATLPVARNPELRLSANDVCLGNSVSGYRDERSWEQRIYGRNIGNG